MDELQLRSKVGEYRIVFNDGSTFVISEDEVHIIDNIWSTDRDGLIDIGGGKKRARDIKSIDPCKDDGFVAEAQSTMRRLESMRKDSRFSTPLSRERREVAIQRTNENFERIKNGGKWQFCDIDGNPCSREEAKKSIF